MYKHILFPVDVTEKDSWRASLKAATEYAQAFDATIHVLTVISDGSISLIQQFFPGESGSKLLEKTQDALKAFVKNNINDSVKVQRIVAKGSVYECIIRTAEEVDADLIVMAAHRPELKDYLLGPNAAKVVRHANRSVLVVRDNA